MAEKIGSNQNAIYRAENPNYGKQTITTLKKIAAEFDVALVVRFVPFSELIDWASGTPRVNDGLNSEALDVPSFDAEEKARKFNDGLLPCPKEELDLRKPVMSAAEKRFKKPIQELRDAIHTAIVKFEDENRLAEVTHIDLKRDAPSSRKLEILAHVVSTPR